MSNNDFDKLTKFMTGYSDLEDHLEFRTAQELVGQKVPVISTGSHLLDDALSSGGYPKGRLIQLYGRSGSGKTLMTLIAIKNAQSEDKNAQQVFLDAEGTFDSNWAETLGVDTSKVLLVEGDLASNGRRLFEMLLGKPKEDSKHKFAGKSKEGLLDKIVSKDININLVILDSLGQIIPPIEDVAEIGKSNMSTLSRFLTITFKKLSVEVKKANIPFIVINHARDNMDPYGGDHTYSGGNTYSHSLSANIWFTAVTRADAQITNDKDEKIGHVMRATVEKSKFGPHPRKCEFAVDFSIGIINEHEEVAELAIKYDIVQRPNKQMYEYGEQKWRGSDNFKDAIKNDHSLKNELLQKINETRDRILEEKRTRQKEKISKNEEPVIDGVEENDVADVLNQAIEKPSKKGRKAKQSE